MVRLLIAAALATLGAAGAPAAGQAPGGPVAGQASACTTSAQYGSCSYPPYSVNQDMWNPGPGSTQTLTAASAGHWQVSTYQPGGAAVRSYPNVSENLGRPISDYTTAQATFAERMPAGAAAEAAFDVWVNGAPGTPSTTGMIEVMIWTENHGNRPAGTKTTTATIGGQTFAVWECRTSSCVGHPYYAFVLSRNESSGTMHILTTLQWLTHHGLIPASDPLTQVDYGWEIRNTGGATRTFAVTSYSLRTVATGRRT
jgi:Glycosyl hydrolase family 12